MSKTFAACLLCLGFVLNLGVSSACQAEDWPGWRGPDRTDIGNESGLLQEWPEGGPDQVWLSSAGGLGYSGFSIVGGRLFTMGLEEASEFVLCLNAETGDVIWKQPIGDKFENRWGDGPRSTPTIDGDHLYALSAQGDLACLSTSDGKPVWSRKMDEFGGRIPSWGYCESVLVDGPNVVCTPGGKEGAIVALNKESGELVWQSSDFTDGAQYSSIIRIDHYGQPQYVQLTQKSVVGLATDTGDVLWKTDWTGRTAVIPTPIYHDGMVYVSSGYGVGCKQFVVTKENEIEEGFVNRNMVNHHGGVIYYEGYFYGHSDGAGWTCQDGTTGERVWNNKDDLDKGAIGFADGCFYCIGEKTGDVVLLAATSEGWEERGRFTLDPQTEQRKPQGRIWTHPVIANGKLYLRDQELIFCFDVKAN